MKHHPVNAYYNIYRLITNRQEHRCVAVSKQFEVEIEKLVKEYGSILHVPVDKTVRGIILECNSGNNFNFALERQENDVTINQLRPYKE